MATTNNDYWEKILQNPPDSFKKWFKIEKNILEDEIAPDAKVLDVACGEGKNINILFPITKNIAGIDNDEQAIIKLKEKFIQYPQIKIICADAVNLPFEDKFFDFVICAGGSLGNFGNAKNKILQEMKRVIKETGYIIISAYSEDAFEERIKIYNKLQIPIREIKGTSVVFDESLGAYTSEQFSKENLEEIFRKAGMKILSIKKAGVAYICKIGRQVVFQ